MQSFFYEAIDTGRRRIRGELSANDRSDALKTLMMKGLRPLHLDRTPISAGLLTKELILGSAPRLRIKDCETFCRNLSLALTTGLSTLEALSTLVPAKHARRSYRDFYRSIADGVREGRSLSTSIGESSLKLPSDLRPVIEAGEASGHLAQALAILADRYRDHGRLARALLGATLYPAFLLLVSLGVLAIVAFSVAPGLTEIFTSMDKPTPALLKALASTSSFLGAHAFESVLLSVALVATSLVAARHEHVHERARAILVRLPVAGQIILWSTAERVAATLHLCLSTHVPADIAADVALAAAGLSRNVVFRSRIATSLRRGDGLAEAMSIEGLLPVEARDLMLVGQRSGHLLEVLESIVAEATARVDARLTLITSLLAPVLILLVGALAGGVIYSVFSGLMDLNTLAQ